MSQDEELVLTGVGLKVAFLGEKPATNYTVRELMLTDLEVRIIKHLALYISELQDHCPVGILPVLTLMGQKLQN